MIAVGRIGASFSAASRFAAPCHERLAASRPNNTDLFISLSFQDSNRQGMVEQCVPRGGRTETAVWVRHPSGGQSQSTRLPADLSSMARVYSSIRLQTRILTRANP